MYKIKVFAVRTGREIGEFNFPRVPVKGDVIDMPTHGIYEVMRVTMYVVVPNDTYVATVQVKPTDLMLDPQ